MEPMVMMHMWFYQGTECVFLFRPFLTTNKVEYTAGLVFTFILAALIELISYSILFIKVKTEKEKKIQPMVGKLAVVSLYGVQMTIALAVMLLVMTFNVLIFFAVVFGIVVGYGVFGFMRLDLQSKVGDKGFGCVAEKCCT